MPQGIAHGAWRKGHSVVKQQIIRFRAYFEVTRRRGKPGLRRRTRPRPSSSKYIESRAREQGRKRPELTLCRAPCAFSPEPFLIFRIPAGA